MGFEWTNLYLVIFYAILVTPAMSFLYYCYVYLTQSSMCNHYCGDLEPNKNASFVLLKYHLGSIAYAAIWFPIKGVFKVFYFVLNPLVNPESKFEIIQ